MVGGSKGSEAASRGAEWRMGRLEVVESGEGAVGLGQSQRKAMTGGVHLSAGHREG
jgi:hypothetical protein